MTDARRFIGNRDFGSVNGRAGLVSNYSFKTRPVLSPSDWKKEKEQGKNG
jgi:hypothetical protein